MSSSEPRASRVINTLRAKHQGEVLAHCITRAEFLRHVGADARVRDLFAFWGEQTGVDAVIDQMVALLDAAARRAGLAHRGALRRAATGNLAPVLGRLQQLEDHYQHLLATTQDARARQVIGFIVAELYGTRLDEEVPIRAWLGSDLLTIFRWEVAARVYGEPVPLLVSRPATITAVPHGPRPKLQGGHLRRDATWYYQTSVQKPRATWEDLAEAYRQDRLAAGIVIGSKDFDGRAAERANDSLVRRGAANAKRLLELPVPPERWTDFLKNPA